MNCQNSNSLTSDIAIYSGFIHKHMETEKKRKITEINLLKLVPKRLIEYSEGEDKFITLLVPKFKNRFLVKYLLPRFKNPFFKIKLDNIGSAVWLLCDGKRNVGEIVDLMKERFEEKIEPCIDRLDLFLTHLEGSNYISFININLHEEPGNNKSP